MARSRSTLRPLRRFTQVDSQSRALVIEAVIWLLLARLALIVVSFPRLAAHWGAFMTPTEARARYATLTQPENAAGIARTVSWAVTRSARYVPFEAVCLQQAMAARVMLKRRGVGSLMHFGAAKGKAKPLDAHAWLDAAGVEVTGYPLMPGLAEIGCFV